MVLFSRLLGGPGSQSSATFISCSSSKVTEMKLSLYLIQLVKQYIMYILFWEQLFPEIAYELGISFITAELNTTALSSGAHLVAVSTEFATCCLPHFHHT
jgi:hypothetical protein